MNHTHVNPPQAGSGRVRLQDAAQLNVDEMKRIIESVGLHAAVQAIERERGLDWLWERLDACNEVPRELTAAEVAHHRDLVKLRDEMKKMAKVAAELREAAGGAWYELELLIHVLGYDHIDADPEMVALGVAGLTEAFVCSKRDVMANAGFIPHIRKRIDELAAKTGVSVTIHQVGCGA